MADRDGIKLPGGFSPVNAFKQVASNTLPGAIYHNKRNNFDYGDVPDYDIFSDWSVRGGDRSPADGSFIGRQAQPQTLAVNTGGTSLTPQQIQAGRDLIRGGGPVLRLNSGTGGTGATGRSGGGGGAVASPADMAMFDQAIQQYQHSLGQLGGQRDTGLRNVQNAYQRQLERLLQNRETTRGRAQDTMLQTEQDNVKTRSGIDASVGRNINSLQRLLGARGAGTSSAAQIAAPTAAAEIGTQQQGDVADAFARNMGNINTALDDFEKDWRLSREDLSGQRTAQRNQVNQAVEQQRQDILGQLGQTHAQRAAAQGMNAQQSLAAGQPFLQQANALSPKINQLGDQFGRDIRAQDPTYTSPDLAQYDYRQFGAPNVQGGAGANVGNYRNIIPGLRRQDEERRR